MKDRANIQLFNEDCLPAMRQMEDNEFDLAIVDPPYGIGNFTQSDRKYRYGEYKWNESIPGEKYFEELKRVSKKRIIWGANYYNCFENGHAAIIWDKQNPHPSMSRCEIASVSWNKRVDYVSIAHYGFVGEHDNFHPSGKPVALYKWLLKNYAEPGDRILDTHLGSGSIAIACWDLGFDLTGFEIDKDYYNDAMKRFKMHTAQLQLDLAV